MRPVGGSCGGCWRRGGGTHGEQLVGELASVQWHGGGWVVPSCPSATLDLHAQLFKAALELTCNPCGGGTQEVSKHSRVIDRLVGHTDAAGKTTRGTHRCYRNKKEGAVKGTANHAKLRMCPEPLPGPWEATTTSPSVRHQRDGGAPACHRYRSELAAAAETRHGSRHSLAWLHKRQRPHPATIQVREMQGNLGHLNEGPAHDGEIPFSPSFPRHRCIGPHATCGKSRQTDPLPDGWLRGTSEATPSREERKRKKRGGRGAGLGCTKRKTLGLVIGPKVGCELSVRRGRRRLDGGIPRGGCGCWSITGAGREEREPEGWPPPVARRMGKPTCLGCAVGGRLGLGLGTAASASPCRDNSEVQSSRDARAGAEVARLWGEEGNLPPGGIRRWRDSGAGWWVCCDGGRFDGRKGRWDEDWMEGWRR